jgi:hypothetical protein
MPKGIDKPPLFVTPYRYNKCKVLGSKLQNCILSPTLSIYFLSFIKQPGKV